MALVLAISEWKHGVCVKQEGVLWVPYGSAALWPAPSNTDEYSAGVSIWPLVWPLHLAVVPLLYVSMVFLPFSFISNLILTL